MAFSVPMEQDIVWSDDGQELHFRQVFGGSITDAITYLNPERPMGDELIMELVKSYVDPKVHQMFSIASWSVRRYRRETQSKSFKG